MKRDETEEQQSVQENVLSNSQISTQQQSKSVLNGWTIFSIYLFVVIFLEGFVLYQVNLRKHEAELKVLKYEAEIETLTKDLNRCQETDKEQKLSIERLQATSRELRQKVKELQNINRDCERHKEELQERINRLKKENAHLEDITKKSELRLSEMISERALDRNDGISKLEENSPMKLAEQFREIYDNEYTDAAEELEQNHGDIGTQKLTKQLLDILEMANNLCINYSSHHQKSIEQSASILQVIVPPPIVTHKFPKNTTYNVSDGQSLRRHWTETFGIPRLCPKGEQELFVKENSTSEKTEETPVDMANVTIDEELSERELRQIYEIKTAVANRMQDRMMEVLTEVIVNTFDVDKENQPYLLTYVQKCLSLCWIMNMKSNPIFIDFVKVSENTKFDTKVFKPFLKSGKYLDYVAWPPLYLHKEGTMIAKGIAEGRG